MELIGRAHERQIINDCIKDDRSHFVVVYGRRRVGKTFLIRQHFNNSFTFYCTGLASVDMEAQLLNFAASLSRSKRRNAERPPTSWAEAFERLIKLLSKSRSKKKVVFLDELPWMDTARSNFISALEYFWNGWASARNDIVLITCGSAASWMLDNLINNKGGLYNRVSRRIKLRPFSLQEVEQFINKRKFKLNRYQIIQLHMIFGGVPYYLDMLRPDESIAQNIDRLIFNEDAQLKGEFRLLFKSLFDKADRHEQIIKALTKRKTGLIRQEIIDRIPHKDGGGITKALEELEASDFISSYTYYGKKSRGRRYQLLDPFTLFHFKYIQDKPQSDNYWMSQINSQSYHSWAGNAFEITCLLHIKNIKNALGIAGIKTESSTWYNNQAQVDLIIDRADDTINVLEIKYAKNPFTISQKYAQQLQQKLASFISATKTKKAVWLVMLTTYGLNPNSYDGDVVKSLTMDDLF